MSLIKTKAEIEIIGEGGKILASILKELVGMVSPGISTADLENRACRLIKKAGGRPAFKNYKSSWDDRPFPTALCTSINDEIVHAPALPPRSLKSGDIIVLDIGMEYPINHSSDTKIIINKHSELGGFYTDMATTVAVGKIDAETARLIKITRECLEIGIGKIKPGNSLNDIGTSIQHHAENAGFSVVRALVGHGVGHEVHEEPQVPHYAIKGSGLENMKLKPGMVIAVEPMINAGAYHVKMLKDGFTVATADGSMSAQFEHTIAVTENGHKILTK